MKKGTGEIIALVLGVASVSAWVAQSSRVIAASYLGDYGSFGVPVATCLCLAIAALFYYRKPKTRYRFSVSSVGSALVAMALSVVSVFLMPFFAQYLVLEVLVIAINGMLIARYLIIWGEVLSEIETRGLVIVVFAAGALEGAFRMVQLSFSDASLAFLTALMPLIVLLCEWFFRRIAAPEPARQPAVPLYYPRTTIASQLWRVLLSLLVYAVIWRLIRIIPPVHAGSYDLGYVAGYSLDIAICLACVVFAVKRPRPISFPHIWLYLMTVFAFTLVLMVFPETAALFSVVSKIIAMLISTFLWLLVADIARHSDIDARSIAAAGWFVYYLGEALAYPMGGFFASTSESAIVVMMFAVTIVVSLLLDWRQPDLQNILSDFASQPVTVEEFTSIDERCRAVGEEHDLTNREIEVMQLICKGRSKAYIAEMLFISLSTVQGHSRKVYKKLGIHSKQELQQLIGL